MSIFLISGIVLAPRAYAFANGESEAMVIGHSDFTSEGTSTTPANQTDMSDPAGLAFDSSGNLWVSDSVFGRVLEFKAPLSTDEAASVVLGESNFTTNSSPCFGIELGLTPSCVAEPAGLAFDSSGNLWVSDSLQNRILEFAPPFSNDENASLVLGMDNFTTGENPDSTPSSSDLNTPLGLAFDSSGNLWVADNRYNRVLEFETPFSTGEAASLVLGQDNFTAGINPNYPGCALGQACPTSSSLDNPQAVAFDSSGDLWVADSAPFRILEFKPPFSNGMSASLVLGEPDFTSYRAGFCEVEASASCFNPYALAFDKSGVLWVADMDFDRVLGFTPPFTTDENASIVLGEPNFTASVPIGETINATKSSLNGPDGIAIDPSGNVWVSDSDNNRVVEFSASVSGSSSVSSASTSSSSVPATSSSSATPSTVVTPTSASVTSSSSSVQSSTHSVIVTSSPQSSASSSSTSLSTSYLAVVAVVLLVMVTVVVVLRRKRYDLR